MINKDENLAYYIQIYNILKKRIEDRIYPPDTLLPSETELAEEFRVTRITVRNAIKKLKEEERIYTEKGKGSFVHAPHIEQSLFRFYSFGRNFAKQNFHTETTVISIDKRQQSDEIFNKLGLSKEQEIVQIVRLRKLEHSPVILEYSYIPSLLAPGILEINLENSSIYDLLEQKYGLKIIRAREYLSADITDEYQSKLLKADICTPVFVTERITYTQGDLPIEYRKSIVRSDKFKFFVDLY
jgi:GntR family transcriptional regulator